MNSSEFGDWVDKIAASVGRIVGVRVKPDHQGYWVTLSGDWGGIQGAGHTFAARLGNLCAWTENWLADRQPAPQKQAADDLRSVIEQARAAIKPKATAS